MPPHPLTTDGILIRTRSMRGAAEEALTHRPDPAHTIEMEDVRPLVRDEQPVPVLVIAVEALSVRARRS